RGGAGGVLHRARPHRRFVDRPIARRRSPCGRRRRGRMTTEVRLSTSSASARVCVALDDSNRSAILESARRFGPRVGWLKIGLEAFVSEGPSLVTEVARHARVFLDLKFHDIPTTVARAVAAAAKTGASMVNVHASGGREMLRQAR